MSRRAWVKIFEAIMKFRDLLSSVSLAALALGVVQASVRAQEQLPTIDVGAPSARAEQDEGEDRAPEYLRLGTLAPAAMAARGRRRILSTRPTSCGTSASARRPKRRSWKRRSTSQSVSQQVLQDQQITDLGEALKNVSGVTIAHGAADFTTATLTTNPNSRFRDPDNIYRDGFRVANGAGLWIAAIRQCGQRRGAQGSRRHGLRAERAGRPRQHHHQAAPGRSLLCGKSSRSALWRNIARRSTPPARSMPTSPLLYRMNMSYENNGAPLGSFVDNTHAQDSVFLAPIIKWNIDADNLGEA